MPATVAILQSTARLQDSGENLELQAPDVPVTNGVPYYAVDAVRYHDRSPWPRGADGAGASLQRVNLAAYGNDPVNFMAALPTPGSQGTTGTPPQIIGQPASRTNSTTTTALFTVSATGSEPLFYQWRLNGSNLDGATNSILVLPNLALENAGAYSAVVVNQAGSTESAPALLTVRAGPSITNQPAAVSVRVPPDPQANPTNRATFNVGAVTYNPPLRYQWLYNANPIPDATNSTYSFTNVTLANEGQYSVLLFDSVATAASAAASLLGLVTPVLTLPPLSQAVPTGAVVTVSAMASGNPLPFTWEWRRISITNQITTNNERFSFYSFLNTNPVGSTVNYRLVLRNAAGIANFLFPIITLADTDRDGLPDDLEVRLGLNTNNAADASLDLDGDGVSNLAEYLAGSDPADTSSFLKLNLSTLAGQPQLSFAAASNKTYSVQYSDGLAPGPWQKLVDVFARTNNRVEAFPDPAPATNRFYRIVTPRQP